MALVAVVDPVDSVVVAAVDPVALVTVEAEVASVAVAAGMEAGPDSEAVVETAATLVEGAGVASQVSND